MTDYIDEVFGSGGLLAQRFEGYRPRAGQIALARAIESGIAGGENVLAEAPTGTGKSVAYLVPASFHGAMSNPARSEPRRRALVVTANIALQEQLIKKDLPMLAEILPWKFSFALAKGRNNYLCLNALDESQAEAALFRPIHSVDEARQWKDIEAWSRLTATGDVSELPFEPLVKLRSKFTISSEDCPGKTCSRYGDCFAEKAKRGFWDADVIVTNYHMLFAHLTVVAASDGAAGVLPPFDVVMLDEAHKLADIARDFLGFRLTAGGMRWATRLLAPKTGTVIDLFLKTEVANLAAKFFAALRMHRRSDDYQARLRDPDPVPSRELVSALTLAGKRMVEASESGALGGDERDKIRRAAERCFTLGATVRSAMELKDADSTVYFIEEEGERTALCSKPISVAAALKLRLFHAGYRSVLMTSATLTTSGNFDYVVGETGADDSNELVVESPFDWKSHALLVVPARMPPPNEKAYAEACSKAVAQVVELARGRTLGLFTSYRVLKMAAEELRATWPGRVLVQGEAPRMSLISSFRSDVDSVLLGTESFWAGIDIPGESLSCVVIDRLPFATPDDPVLDAIGERDRKAFFNHQIPRAVIALRQGAGRLIRSAADRGVVVILDPRIVTKGYGKTFVKSLPAMKLSRELADVRRFLDDIAPARPALAAVGGAR